jgi:hypothetical protein
MSGCSSGALALKVPLMAESQLPQTLFPMQAKLANTQVALPICQLLFYKLNPHRNPMKAVLLPFLVNKQENQDTGSE